MSRLDDATLDGLWRAATAQLADETLGPSETVRPEPPAWADRGQLAPEPSLRTLGTLGEGGMGVVHLAEQVHIGRLVAVKTLRADVQSASAVGKLLQEARLSARLEHPNIVPIHDIAPGPDGRPAIVMRRIQGHRWSDLLRDPALSARLLGVTDPLVAHLRVLTQVCNALAYAHDQGVIHRDLKPDNVMIGDFGEVWLLDWGIAVCLTDDGTGRFPIAGADRRIAGTPHYMAPEQVAPSLALPSPATDVFLLGAVLYEILSGQPPHRGESVEAALRAALSPPARLAGELPSELVALCDRALAFLAEDRPPSAAAFRLSIERFLDHRGALALCDEADQHLAGLYDTLADAPLRDADAHRARHARYAAARFGYQQALRAWPDAERAREGLHDLVERMVRYELERDDPAAASVLLADLADPPEALRERVQVRLAAEAAERAAARDLGAMHSRQDGAERRYWVGVSVGLIWAAMPLSGAPLNAWFGDPTGFGVLVLWTLAFGAGAVVIAGPLLWFARSYLNRGMLSLVLALPPLQLTLLAGIWAGGYHAAALPLALLLWSGVAWAGAILLDTRLVPAAALYSAGWVLAAAFPAWSYVIITACHLSLTLTTALAWRGDRQLIQ